MKPKAYAILCRAIEEGIARGIRQHYKHRDDDPGVRANDHLGDAIYDAVTLEVCEVFTFSDETDPG